MNNFKDLQMNPYEYCICGINILNIYLVCRGTQKMLSHSCFSHSQSALMEWIKIIFSTINNLNCALYLTQNYTRENCDCIIQRIIIWNTFDTTFGIFSIKYCQSSQSKYIKCTCYTCECYILILINNETRLVSSSQYQILVKFEGSLYQLWYIFYI